MKTKVLIYCTKGTLLNSLFVKYRCLDMKLPFYEITNARDFPKEIREKCDNILNGKIVAECEVEVEEITYLNGAPYPYIYPYIFNDSALKKTCLSYKELGDYLFPNNGYALHISNLKVFDIPMELSEVGTRKKCKNCQYNFDCFYHPEVVCDDIPLTRAPQNMMWVWYKGERYCLISIRPEWVCKILNGEKDIEVRKKVLKGMI